MQNMNNVRPDAFFQQFRYWDLNLLVVFEALSCEQGNVSRAAKRIGLSQSAMSHALNRLREMLADPLFVKQGHRMHPTARAVALAPVIAGWLENIRGQLNPPIFDPATIQQEINVAIPEHLERLVLPQLLSFLAQHAPGLHFHSRPVPIAQLADAFARQRIDMAIIGHDLLQTESYSQCKLTESRFVYVYDEQQLRLPEPASLAELAAVPHLASNYSHKTATIIDNHFAAQGLRRRIVATSGGITAIPAILAASPLLTILPEVMITDHPLFERLKKVPFETGQVQVALYLVWHKLHEHDLVQHFVRSWIIRYFAGQPD